MAKIDTKSPEGIAFIAKAVAKETAGLKINRDKIMREKKKLQAEIKTFKGIDPKEHADLKAKKKQIDNFKIKGKSDFQEAMQKEKDAWKKQTDKTIADLTKKNKKLVESKEKVVGLYTGSLLEEQVSKEATKQGVTSESLEDVIAKARGVFTVNDEYELESRGEDGKLKTNEDDTLVTPETFIKGLKETASRYWGTSKGAGITSPKNQTEADKQLKEAAKEGNMAKYKAVKAAQQKAAAKADA